MEDGLPVAGSAPEATIGRLGVATAGNGLRVPRDLARAERAWAEKMQTGGVAGA